MPKTATASDAVALIEQALTAGRTVLVSLAARPQVDRVPAMVTAGCLRFGMTPSEARVLVELIERGYSSKQNLHAAMCDGRGASGLKTLNTVVCKLRQKLAGVTIETVWGSGYRLDENDRGRLRKILAAVTPAAGQQAPGG